MQCCYMEAVTVTLRLPRDEKLKPFREHLGNSILVRVSLSDNNRKKTHMHRLQTEGRICAPGCTVVRFTTLALLHNQGCE